MSTQLFKNGEDDDRFFMKTAEKTTLADIESLAMPLVQQVVFLADFKCLTCQERVAEIMSRMDGETQSVVISVLKKTVTVTTEVHRRDRGGSGSGGGDGDNDKKLVAASHARRKMAPMHLNPWSKASLIMRLLHTMRN